MALTVDANIASDEDLFGKVVADLQKNISVGETGIGGTVKYISDYSSAGYAGDEVAGHFLVLHADVPNENGVTITAELIGGIHGPVTLDADGILITRVTSTQQKIRFTASKDGEKDVTKIFTLNGLKLA